MKKLKFNQVIKNRENLIALLSQLRQLWDVRTVYSRTGGGAANILLINTENNVSLWVWCYWEIKKSGVTLATSNDDATAVVGKMAVAARQLEGKKILITGIDPVWYSLHVYFEDDYELLIYCEPQLPHYKHHLHNWDLVIEDSYIKYIITRKFTIRRMKSK